MDLVPLKVVGKCVAGDEELLSNMEAAIVRGYQEILKAENPRDGVIAIVGSGPSVKGQLETIRKMQETGTPVVAVKDCHDWLIRHGLIPDYAFAVDPQAHRWNCFTLKDSRVHYMIASQCNAAMFDHLQGNKVSIWHPYVMKDQKRPLNRMVIGGGTTSGLRAIALFYVLGWRHFSLFGFDSCLDKGVLRVNGDTVKKGDYVTNVQLEPHGETFYCNPSMALQAQHFQMHYEWLPDANFYPYGHGLIQSIIRKREANALELDKIAALSKTPNERVSFIHCMDETQASYRYRAKIPAEYIGASLNDLTADTLIFAKPHAHELMDMARAKARGAWVVADFCDDHFEWMHYQEALRLADAVTCPTVAMQTLIKGMGRDAVVIGESYESPEVLPHCNGVNLLWFGHQVNRDSLARIMPDIAEYPLRVVSNFKGSIPWSQQVMDREFVSADIVIIPATDKNKSNNRTLEAIRNGCFVVAEPHPSLMDIPGIWIGNIKEGIEWTRQNLAMARARTLTAQSYVKAQYGPQTLASAWRNAIQRPITSEAEKSTGTDG